MNLKNDEEYEEYEYDEEEEFEEYEEDILEDEVIDKEEDKDDGTSKPNIKIEYIDKSKKTEEKKKKS